MSSISGMATLTLFGGGRQEEVPQVGIKLTAKASVAAPPRLLLPLSTRHGMTGSGSWATKMAAEKPVLSAFSMTADNQWRRQACMDSWQRREGSSYVSQ